MEKMKKIESKEDFLKWAHDVNFCMEAKKNHICDLQDVFHKDQDAEMKQLKGWFLEVTASEKQLLTFSIIKAMGEEMAYRFIKTWALRQTNIAIEEQQKDIEEEYKKLSDSKFTFATEKREIENTLSNLQITVNELKDALKLSQMNNDGLHATISRLQQTIDTQNENLNAAYKALNEADKFKTYLKSVISSDVKID